MILIFAYYVVRLFAYYVVRLFAYYVISTESGIIIPWSESPFLQKTWFIFFVDSTQIYVLERIRYGFFLIVASVFFSYDMTLDVQTKVWTPESKECARL